VTKLIKGAHGTRRRIPVGVAVSAEPTDAEREPEPQTV
jgi:hypothetical protein